MPKIYTWALIAAATAAIAYTCFSTYSKQTAPVSNDSTELSLDTEQISEAPTQKRRKLLKIELVLQKKEQKFEYDMLKDPKTGKIPEGIETRAKKTSLTSTYT